MSWSPIALRPSSRALLQNQLSFALFGCMLARWTPLATWVSPQQKHRQLNKAGCHQSYCVTT